MVYYVQESSTAVWFYEYHNSPHVEFTLSEFNRLAKAFVESWTDTDENGCMPSFLDFVAQYDEHSDKADNQVNNDSSKGELDNQISCNNDESKTKYNRTVLVLVAVGFVALTAVGICVWRKKKKC